LSWFLFGVTFSVFGARVPRRARPRLWLAPNGGFYLYPLEGSSKKKKSFSHAFSFSNQTAVFYFCLPRRKTAALEEIFPFDFLVFRSTTLVRKGEKLGALRAP